MSKPRALAEHPNTRGTAAVANILGTVSLASGVPTGAIIERDSNTNGEYVKFADGTLICTRSANLTPFASGTPLGFAVNFALPPVVSLGAVGDISSVQQRQTLRDTVLRSYTNAWEIRLEKSESYIEVVMNYGLSAIGRWF